MRRTVVAVLAAALAGCGSRHASGSAAATTAPAVTTVRARSGTLETTLSATGRIGPPAGSDAKLAFASPGIVANVFVRPGQAVVAGESLATLDRRALADALAQARADANAAAATYAGGSSAAVLAASARAKYDAAQAHLEALRRGGPAALSDRIAAVAVARQAALKVELDRRALDRASALFAGGVTAAKDVDAARSLLASDVADRQSADARVAAAGASYVSALRGAAADAAQAKSDLVAARAAIGTARAQRDSAVARLAGAGTEYDRAVLTAPSDGIVVSVLKHPGEAVDPTTPVVDVVPPENGQVTLALSSDDAARIAVGAPVRLALVASGATANARVAAVIPAVDATTQAVTVVARGILPGAVAGQAVDATIVIGRTRGVVVPATSIVTDPQNGTTVVFVRDRASHDTPYVSHAVAVRANDGTSAIVAGIRVGDEIAARGAYDLLAPSGS